MSLKAWRQYKVAFESTRHNGVWVQTLEGKRLKSWRYTTQICRPTNSLQCPPLIATACNSTRNTCKSWSVWNWMDKDDYPYRSIISQLRSREMACVNSHQAHGSIGILQSSSHVQWCEPGFVELPFQPVEGNCIEFCPGEGGFDHLATGQLAQIFGQVLKTCQRNVPNCHWLFHGPNPLDQRKDGLLKALLLSPYLEKDAASNWCKMIWNWWMSWWIIDVCCGGYSGFHVNIVLYYDVYIYIS